MNQQEKLNVYIFAKRAGIGDYRPFNTSDSLQGSLYGAGIGALTGAGIQGLRKLFGGGDPNSSTLGSLLRGALWGGGAGAALPLLGGLIGPSVGGFLGKRQLINDSGIKDVKGQVPKADYNVAYDTIGSMGKNYGREATKQITIRDIARKFGLGGGSPQIGPQV